MSNRFAKSLFSFSLVFSLVLIFAVNGAAQNNCDSIKAPDLFDLRLGMTPEQARAALDNELKIKFKKNGERTFFQNFIEKRAPASLQNVRAVYLRFFDRKLYQIEIFYEEKSGWETLENFAAALSSETGISASNWQNVKGKAVIDCGEFTFVADKILNPHVELTDKIALAQVEAGRQKNK